MKTESYRPDLPDWIMIARWPSPGHAWIHPHDISIATQLLPSRRVFQRVRFDSLFYHLRYGDVTIRVRPCMCQAMPTCDIHVGDQVEILSQLGQYDPGIASVDEVFGNERGDSILFLIRKSGMRLPQYFTREQLRHLSPRYQLRVGYYQHPPARFIPPANLELLHVADLDT